MKWWVEDGWLRARDADSEYKMRVKPHPEAWMKAPDDYFWRAFEPDLPIPDQDISERIFKAKSRFRKEGIMQRHLAIRHRDYLPEFFPQKDNPHAILWLLSGLPNATRWLLQEMPFDAWQLIVFLHKFGSPMLDLFQSNRFLALALFELTSLGRDPEGKQKECRSLHGDLKKPQKYLLPSLGLPVEERIVKLLRKTSCDLLPCWQEVRAQMPAMLELKVTSHLRQLNWMVWEALKKHRDGQVSAALVIELSEEPENMDWDWERKLKILVDTHRLMEKPLPVFNSTGQIKKHYDELEKKIPNTASPKGDGRKIIPAWEGTESIRPLVSEWDYLREGLEMRNCIASSFGSALERQVFHYRVLKPERATLELEPGDSFTGWSIRQLRCRCNQMPKESTHSHLTEVVQNIQHDPEPTSVRNHVQPQIHASFSDRSCI
jgi:hypothetical protein